MKKIIAWILTLTLLLLCCPVASLQVRAEAAVSLAYVDAPVAGTAYKFVMNQANLEKDLGFTGAMDGYYYGTSESIDEMVDVYLEEAEGGYCVYFLAEGVKTYLNIIPRETDATKTNVVLQTLEENAAPSVYVLNLSTSRPLSTKWTGTWAPTAPGARSPRLRLPTSRTPPKSASASLLSGLLLPGQWSPKPPR